MEDTITFSHSHKFGKNIALFSESICQHTSFEIFESIIRALRYWEENSLFEQNSVSIPRRTISHSHTLTCLAQNGSLALCTSESFCREDKFDILGTKLRALEKVRQKSLSSPSQTISPSHTLRCLAKHGIYLYEGFCEYKKFEILANKIG